MPPTRCLYATICPLTQATSRVLMTNKGAYMSNTAVAKIEETTALRPAFLMHALVSLFNARYPVLLKGAPGTGKTDIVKEAAKLAKRDIIIMHPVVSDP